MAGGSNAENGRAGGLAAQARARGLRDAALGITRARTASMLGKSHRKAEPPPPRVPSPTNWNVPPAKTCQWPLSDSRPWRFCDAPTEAGSSYCDAHHTMCHAKSASE